VDRLRRRSSARRSQCEIHAEDDHLTSDPEGFEDQWDQFVGEDIEPISIAELKDLPLASLPENACVPVMDNNFPDVAIRRESDAFVCEIREHLYTKYWEHKFSLFVESRAR
jgi:hypothetical protein